jgi:hypothetical protein
MKLLIMQLPPVSLSLSLRSKCSVLKYHPIYVILLGRENKSYIRIKQVNYNYEYFNLGLFTVRNWEDYKFCAVR